MCAYNYLENSDSVNNVISFRRKNSTSPYGSRDCEVFLPQTNGEVSDSIVQNWTLQAYECYSLNCNCKECSIGKGNYSFVCQMGKIVNVLIKTKGEPNPDDFLSD